MKLKLILLIIFLVIVIGLLYSQTGKLNTFESSLDLTNRLLEKTSDSLRKYLVVLMKFENLNHIQEARINLIQSKLYLIEEMLPELTNHEMLIHDGVNLQGRRIQKAVNLIIQSRPDEGIPLIIKFIEDVDNQSDSVVYAKIFLTEAYRQKREYDKGIDMLYSILANHSISEANRAFALNRMAALQNEKQPFEGNRADSVSKYSRLCLDISQKNNLIEYLAASQNELGNNYLGLKMPDTALIFFSEAAKNFLSIHKYPQAINTYLNLSRLYSQTGQLEESKEILLKALELGNIEENRNLFMYVYYYLADRSFKLGDNKGAYEYLKIAYSLMSYFYNDRIQLQINEMSAKYDLHEKEARIKEEAQKSKTYRLQLKYIVVISLISTILLAVLVVLSRFRNRAYKKLVEQNLKAMKLEKQVEICLRNLSEHDIMNSVEPLDQNAELALRLEKFMAEEKPYLWGDVGLEEFCKKLNTNRTYLSKLINDKYQMSFYDLLFEYRVRTALECLNNPEFKHLSVEGIGEMAGFKSNSNFYKRFKNKVGMTPHQFREKAQELEKRLPA